MSNKPSKRSSAERKRDDVGSGLEDEVEDLGLNAGRIKNSGSIGVTVYNSAVCEI